MRLKSLLLSATLAFFPIEAFAKDIMIVSDNQEIKADISLQSPTRISLKYDSGSQLIFNSPEGTSPEVTATVDGKGDIYLSVIEGRPGQTISGFLTTEAGNTYLLKLTIKAVEAGQLELVNAKAREEVEKAKSKTKTNVDDELPVLHWQKNSDYHNNIALLMRALYYGAKPNGFKKVRNGRPVVLDDYTASPLITWQTENLEAVTYRLTNNREYFVNPANSFDQWRPFVALSFTNDSLEPGETTDIYLVKKRGD